MKAERFNWAYYGDLLESKMKKACICSFTTVHIIKHTGVKPCHQLSGNIYNATVKGNFVI